MAKTVTSDVLTGKDAKAFVSAVSVNYSDSALKDAIFNMANDDTYLLITKEIGSKITITSVKIVDDALIESMLT